MKAQGIKLSMELVEVVCDGTEHRSAGHQREAPLAAFSRSLAGIG